jgi:hypothetical protein
MEPKRLDIVFDQDIPMDKIDIMNKHIWALFGEEANIDWRDDRTVEITIFKMDIGISTPRPWADKPWR